MSNVAGHDVANRLVTVGGTFSQAYAANNERVYYRSTSGTDTIYLYGAFGEKLATYTITGYQGSEIMLTQQSTNVYFAGRLVTAEGNLVSTDLVGSVRWSAGGGATARTYFPYGTEYATTGNDTEKYATYTRDSLTGLDYAMNRYYYRAWGRFLSPDPYSGSMNFNDPQSLNRYAYVANDPVNGFDPSGLVIPAPIELPPIRWNDPTDANWMNLYTMFPGPQRPAQPVVTLAQWDDVHPRPRRANRARWRALSDECRRGLMTAQPVAANLVDTDYAINQWLNVLDAATNQKSTIQNAIGTTLPWSWVAAIGIRESGFGTQDGTSSNIYQITSQNLGAKEAASVFSASQWVGVYLNHNLNALMKAGLTGNALLDATFDTYNAGLTGVEDALAKQKDPDTMTKGHNYGANILQLLKCF